MIEAAFPCMPKWRVPQIMRQTHRFNQIRVNEKPRRIVALRSDAEMPGLDDSASNRKTIAWKADPHQGHYLRETLDFTYDQTRQTVTVILDFGIRQLVWE